MTGDVDTSSEADGEEARPPGLVATSLAEPRRALLSRAGPRHAVDGDSVDKQLARRALFPTKVEKVTIGRFTVLRQIGQGGMGVVYACHDHQLDRKVAVKVLRAEAALGLATADTRLLREAQAMARLSHANIVTVHEVGEADGSVYVAMEFIDGTGLDAWMKQPHPWPAIVAAFVQAGRGLAAAHRAGIIHRDFKPQNAVRTVDGTVKVLDFGLARAAEGDVREELLASAPDGAAADHHLMRPLTRTGALLGTPAYMSPEQHRGEVATAASDQFNFCVSLYQGLHGALPFASGSYAALRDDVMHGRVAPPPARSRVPAYIHRAIERGLSPRPEDRFASMDELLARIERDPRTRVRRAAALAVTLAATGAASVALFGGDGQGRCPDAQAELAGVWDAGRVEAVRAAVRAADPTLATETLARLVPRLERYADAWRSLRNDACRAHAEGRQSMQVFDLRTACLDQRRASLDAVVDALATADATSLELLPRAVASLPPIEGCADVNALSAEVPPPEPGIRADAQRHREALARAEVLEQTAQIPRGLHLVEAVLADPKTAAYEPLRAEALLRRGGLQMRDGAWAAALTSFEEALWTAVGVGHAAVAAQASSRRGFLLATPLTRPAQALADLPMIAALNRRVQRDVGLYAEFLVNAGTIYMQAKDLERARESWQQATALLEQHGRLETPLGLNVLANAAILAIETERIEEAATTLRRVVALSEQLMGPRQPERANFEGVLSGALIELGRPRESLARMRALHARMGEVQSKGARFVATLLLARAEIAGGEPQAALRRMGELRRADPGLFGPVYAPMMMLAAAQAGDAAAVGAAEVEARGYIEGADPREAGFAQAIESYAWATRAAGLESMAVGPLERARAAFAGSDDPRDVATGARLSLDLGRARLQIGELDAAESDLRAARDAFERALPSHHLDRADALLALAELARTRGERREAATHASEAAAIYAVTAEQDYPPWVRARALLAQATGG